MEEQRQPEPVELIRDLRVEERQQPAHLIQAVHLGASAGSEAPPWQWGGGQVRGQPGPCPASQTQGPATPALTWEQSVASSWKYPCMKSQYSRVVISQLGAQRGTGVRAPSTPAHSQHRWWEGGGPVSEMRALGKALPHPAHTTGGPRVGEGERGTGARGG